MRYNNSGKLFLACLLAVLFALPAAGAPLDGRRAADAARAFFQRDENRALRLAPIERVPLERAPLTKAGDEAPAFYIYNRQGGGFVIIGGDDACAPVLGYSFTGRFGTGDAMPDGLRSWLEDLEEQVAIARSEGASSSRSFAAEWSSLFVPTKGVAEYKPEVAYETPCWGQNTPFNRLTPTVNGEKTAAGCVPLTMSMLCRFYTYPLAGTGTLSSYSYSPNSGGGDQSIEGFDLGYNYDWANIRMDYRNGYSEAEADAVARLVYDCGVMTQATYDKETGSTIYAMTRAAIEHLGYDAAATGVSRNYYTDAHWADLLKAELQEHPVMYSARREEGGHAFLLDGYDKNGYFRINWGWSGDSNGYFRLEAFSPNAQRQYVYKHAAILGLKPNAGGTTQEYLYLLAGTSSSSGTEFHGLEASGAIEARKDFVMKLGGVSNGGNEVFEGYFILGLFGADGSFKDWVCGSQLIDPLKPRYWRGYTNISCRMNVFPQEGDYIKPMYRSIKWADDDWRDFLYEKTEGITLTVPVFDNVTLAQATSVAYSTTLNELTVETKDNVTWSLTSASGSSMDSYVTYSVTTMTIRAGEMPRGTYTLTLKRGADQVKLNLKMGKK